MNQERLELEKDIGMKIGMFVGKIVGMIVFALFYAVFMGLAVKLLWNALMPELFRLPVISFFQSIGLLLLSHILFRGGGIRPNTGEKARKRYRRRFEERWAKMTPEEREQKLRKWRGRDFEDKKETGASSAPQTPPETVSEVGPENPPST